MRLISFNEMAAKARHQTEARRRLVNAMRMGAGARMFAKHLAGYALDGEWFAKRTRRFLDLGEDIVPEASACECHKRFSSG